MADKKTERDERLAKALRDNLKRRKTVAREAGPQERKTTVRPERSAAQSKGAGAEP